MMPYFEKNPVHRLDDSLACEFELALLNLNSSF